MPLFILSHRMYEVTTYDVHMALVFQKDLFRYGSKKIMYPFFWYKVISNSKLISTRKSNN